MNSNFRNPCEMSSLFLLLGCLLHFGNAMENTFSVPLYGEKLKGFMTVGNVKDDLYVLTFQLDGAPSDTRISLHHSVAPYDSGMMAENCRFARKADVVFRNKTLDEKEITVKIDDLSGHTILLGNEEEVYACATVIIGSKPLLVANFHADPVQGPIHIIPLKNKVRLLPDLKYVPHYDGSLGLEFIDWAFVEKCDSQNAYQNAAGMELGVDSRATTTIETSGYNVSLINFQLFKSGKPFACAPIVNVESRRLRALGLYLTQPHYFTAVRSEGEDVEELRIREDCLDLATETIHKKFHDYFPSVSIFGPDTIMLKSVVVKEQCSTLRPQFPLPSAVADFFHPAFGRLVLVDTEDRVLLTGQLRSLTDSQAARATVQISPKFAPSAGCPLYLDDCAECFTVPDAAVIVGKDDAEVSLIGVLPYFNIQNMRSVIVDLQWSEEPFHVCANLTHLPSGALQASASAKRYSSVSAKTVANVVVLEYPANNNTEVIFSKTAPIDSVAVHTRPVDMSATSGPPCGEQTIGPKAATDPKWLKKFEEAVKDKKDTVSFSIPGQLLSGEDNILGTSLLFSHDKESYCGSFELPEEKKYLVAKFTDEVEGYLTLSQYEVSGQVPTEVSFFLQRPNSSNIEKESFHWDIVLDSNLTCDGAIVFDPFQANDTFCSFSTRHLCPIGSAGQKSSELQCGTRKHLTVPTLPLIGPYSVEGKTIRLRSTITNETVCSELIVMEEANFRWTVFSNESLSSIRSRLADRLNMDPFQVKVDYNRELQGGKCSIYTITVLETSSRVAEILQIFDVEHKKFFDDDALICQEKDEAKVVSEGNKTAAGPKPKSAHIPLLSCYFPIIFLVCIYW